MDYSFIIQIKYLNFENQLMNFLAPLWQEMS